MKELFAYVSSNVQASQATDHVEKNWRGHAGRNLDNSGQYTEGSQ